MTNTTMSQKQALTIAIESIGDTNPKAVEKLTAMLTTLENKKHTVSKATLAKREENKQYAEKIVEILSNVDTPMNRNDIADALEGEISVGRITPICTSLIADGRIEKVMVKKIAHYQIVE